MPSNSTYSSFVGGRCLGSEGGAGVLDLENPATREPVGRVALATEQQVASAVDIAKAAQRVWWSFGPARRAELMFAWAALIREEAAHIAALDTATVGRLRVEAESDVLRSVAELEHWAYRGQDFFGAAEHTHIPDTLYLTAARPVGVCGLLLPGNVPSRMFLVHTAVALGLGNSVVAKPAEYSPLSALRFAELAVAAGIPPGVVNVIAGAGPAGAVLAAHPNVGGLSFTGSTATGVHVAAAAARRFAKVSLELGGKSPQLVFDDADVDAAAEAIIWSVCSNAGQVCTAGTRALVHYSVYAPLVQRLAELAGRVCIGDPARSDVHMGPLSTRRQFDKVRDLVAVGAREARLVHGGEPAAEAGDGYYHQPTIFADVPAQARVFQEEIFGPVLCVTPFITDAEAIALANDSAFGLAANIWTGDFRRAMRVAHALEVGTVWYGSSRIGDPHLPLRAGAKSGGSFHRRLVDAFTQDRTIGMPLTEDDFGPSWRLNEVRA